MVVFIANIFANSHKAVLPENQNLKNQKLKKIVGVHEV